MRLIWQFRTLSVFVILTLFMVALGFFIGNIFDNGLLGFSVMLIISILISFYAYWFSKQSALRANRVRLITREENPRLYNTVEMLAKKAGLPMPEVGISECPMPNAFATGRNPKNAAVVATRGLLNILNDDELEGVLAHEMSHVKNRDILVMSVASTVVSVLTFASRMVFYTVLFNGNSRDENRGIMLVIGLVCAIFVPIAALILQLAVSRNREYLADETGGRMCGKPLALASALNRLEYGCAQSTNTYSDTAHADMWICNPVRKESIFRNLFRTHPTTPDRIKRLEALAEKMGDGSIPEYDPNENPSRSKLTFK